MSDRELGILVRAKGATQAASQIGKVDKAIGGLTKTGVALGTAGGIILEKVAGAAVSQLGGAIKAASDLNETQSKVRVVFGASADEVLRFGRNAASALGLSENDAEAAAGTFGNLFTAMGLGVGKSADMSLKLVTLAGDLASFNNLDPTDVLEKLRAGLTGESEPLKTLGVNINETIIKAKALELGLVKTTASTAEITAAQQDYDAATKDLNATIKKYGTGSDQTLKATLKQEKAQDKLETATNKIPATLDAATKAQAAYALIFEQTATAQGDFGRTSGGLANQQRILKANLQNTAAVIGTALLPKVTELVSKVNKLVTDNRPAIEAFAAQLPGAFDAALGFAEKIPWSAVASGLQAAAQFSGQLFSVFANMPAEAQASIIALAGLNKISGGAVTNIVSELGKGLIKGVLGMNAGVVNINAGVVNGGGAGGAGNLLPAAGGAAGAAGTASGLGLGAIAVGIVGGVVISSASLLALGKIVEATSTPEQLKASRIAFDSQQVLKHTGMTLDQLNAKTSAVAAGVNATRDAVIRQKLSVAITNINKVAISARDVVTQTTTLKVLAGGIQQI